MGSRPSTPNSPVEARGSRSRTGYPNEGDQSSNDVVGPVEPILGHGEFLERREVPGSNASLPGWGFRRGALNAECFGWMRPTAKLHRHRFGRHHEFFVTLRDKEHSL